MLYKNPLEFLDGLERTNPDPYILRWCGNYYCYATDEAGVKVSVSGDLIHWEYKGYAISDENYHDYWAPSVMYRNGIFYMYYSNVLNGTEDVHEEHLKLAVSREPLGPFEHVKTFFDEFSIDSHPVEWNGQLHMLYSVNNWIGTDDKKAGTCILRDRMKTPEEFTGAPEAVILPSLKEEIYEQNRFGDGRDWYTIEGACILNHGKYCWMMYSANAYEKEDYFVGTAVSEYKDDFAQMEFQKYPDETHCVPLLKKNSEVEGTGHNTVTKAPNMVDDWIVYHGRDASQPLIMGTEQRVMRADPIFYNGKQMICAGPSAELKEGPRRAMRSIRCKDISRELELEGGPFYLMEIWLSAVKQHCGVRYSIFLDYLNEDNYVELQVISGQRRVMIFQKKAGVLSVLYSQKISCEFDYSCPQLFTIRKQKRKFFVRLNNEEEYSVYAAEQKIGNKMKVKSHFSVLHIHSLDLTAHAELEGTDLNDMTEFYRVSNGSLKKEGLCGLHGTVELQKLDCGNCFRDEFTLEAMNQDAELSVKVGDETVLRQIVPGGSSTLYFVKDDKRTGVYFAGKFTDINFQMPGKVSFILHNIKIIAFYNTKI